MHASDTKTRSLPVSAKRCRFMFQWRDSSAESIKSVKKLGADHSVKFTLVGKVLGIIYFCEISFFFLFQMIFENFQT